MLDLRPLVDQEPIELDDPLIFFGLPNKRLEQALSMTLDEVGLKVVGVTYSGLQNDQQLSYYLDDIYVVCQTYPSNPERSVPIHEIVKSWRYGSRRAEIKLIRHTAKDHGNTFNTKTVWLHFVITTQPDRFHAAGSYRA